MSTKPLIDVLRVRAGRKAGVYLEAEVRGELVYMPLSPESARIIATELEKAATAIETSSASSPLPH